MRASKLVMCALSSTQALTRLDEALVRSVQCSKQARKALARGDVPVAWLDVTAAEGSENPTALSLHLYEGGTIPANTAALCTGGGVKQIVSNGGRLGGAFAVACNDGKVGAWGTSGRTRPKAWLASNRSLTKQNACTHSQLSMLGRKHAHARMQIDKTLGTSRRMHELHAFGATFLTMFRVLTLYTHVFECHQYDLSLVGTFHGSFVLDKETQFSFF